jgi:hypothetical protein
MQNGDRLSPETALVWLHYLECESRCDGRVEGIAARRKYIEGDLHRKGRIAADSFRPHHVSGGAADGLGVYIHVESPHEN